MKFGLFIFVLPLFHTPLSKLFRHFPFALGTYLPLESMLPFNVIILVNFYLVFYHVICTEIDIINRMDIEYVDIAHHKNISPC